MSFPGFIGKKLGMTQVFENEREAVPVTVVQLLPLTVTQIKTPEKDGYSAIQVGFQVAKEKHLTKAQQGHLKKNDIELVRHLKEFRVSAEMLAEYTVGQKIELVDGLEENMFLDVTGQSIGKGFQGNTKRWGHHRGLMSHGSKSHRLPGSIGAGTTPGRVFKGTQMAGNMGNQTVTTQNLRVVKVIPEKNVVLVQGSVPGVEDGTLILRPAVKRKVAAS